MTDSRTTDSQRPGLTRAAGTPPATNGPAPPHLAVGAETNAKGIMAANPTIEEPRWLLRIATAPLQRSVVRRPRRLSWPRLVNGDGTPTMWWAFIAIVAPAFVVLSIIAIAIVQQ